MKLDKTNLMATLTAIAVIVAAIFIRESFELARKAGSVGNLETPALETDRSNPHVPQNALTEQEHAQYVELRQRYGSMEKLKNIFNPQTSEERQQARMENTLTPYDHANFEYDFEWMEFVDGLDLNPEDTRLVRDIWVESKARFIELGISGGDGTLESGTLTEAQEEVENRLFSILSQILSPEQMTAFQDHEEQLVMDTLASSQAFQEELIDTGYSGLILAAVENDLSTVQAYLASGADPNRLSTNGKSAIHEAAIINNPEMLRALIDAGADVNLTMPGGKSALMVAATFGSTDAARVLVEAGADPNYIRSDNPFENALFSAALDGHTEIVRVLLDAGADASGVVGEFALESAIGFGDHEMEQMLIKSGADTGAPRVEKRRSFFDLGRRLGLVDD